MFSNTHRPLIASAKLPVDGPGQCLLDVRVDRGSVGGKRARTCGVEHSSYGAGNAGGGSADNEFESVA